MLLKGQESQFCFVLFSLGFFVVCFSDYCDCSFTLLNLEVFVAHIQGPNLPS